MSDKLRIAVLSPVWFAVPPTGYGGIELVVSLLADGLVDAGHDVTLFASGDSLTKAKLSYIFEEAPSELIGRTLPEMRHAFACYTRADEFDVINDHSGIPAAALGGLLETPVLHTVHGPLDTHRGAARVRVDRQALAGREADLDLREPAAPDARPAVGGDDPERDRPRSLPEQAAPRRVPALPGPLQPGQGRAPGDRGRDGAGPAAEDGGQEPRAEGAAVLRRVRRAAPRQTGSSTSARSRTARRSSCSRTRAPRSSRSSGRSRSGSS